MEFPSKKELKKVEIKPGPENHLKEAGAIISPEISLEKKEVVSGEGGEAPRIGRKTLTFIKKKQEETIQLTKSETLKEIERILVENLDPYYQTLPGRLKEQFKKEGEETASKIERIIESAKIVAGRIFNLIISWLKIIPSINKFFVFQEAKIKTDKIIALAEKKRRAKLSS